MLNANEFHEFMTEEGFQPEFVEDNEELIICCPSCEDDRARLYINATHGGYRCFHCGEQGNLHQFLINVVGLNGSKAFLLRDRFWVEDDYEEEIIVKRRAAAATISDVILHLPGDYQLVESSSPARYINYLSERHVSISLAQRYGIGYIEDGYWGRRVIVPVSNGGHLYTWIARSVLKKCPNCKEVMNDCSCVDDQGRTKKYPKVLTPLKKRGAQPKLTLYNLDAVRSSGSDRVVVVEGVFDALRLPKEAVATLGASASPTQISLIAGLSRDRECVIAYDPDQAGYLGAAKVAEALISQGISPRVAVLPSDQDVGSIGDVEKYLRRARPYVL